MPGNNNQKSGRSAAARLAQLPVVHSACVKLSLVYTDTKGLHPKLRSVCEVLESSVTALLSPVIVKLEPHMSIPNDIACKGLDWLETTFPVVHTPAEQIATTAAGKMNEIQALVSIAANGSLVCMHMALTWLMDTMQQNVPQPDGSLVKGVVCVTSKGLNLAISLSEALVDRKRLIGSDDREDDGALKTVEGFERNTPPNYRAHLVSVAAKTYRRTQHHRVGSNPEPDQMTSRLSNSPVVIQEVHTSWQTLALSIQGLPKYIHNQLGCLQLFLIQIYYLFSPLYQNYLQDRAKAPPPDEDQSDVQVTPVSHRVRRPQFDKCNVKGCVGR